MSGPIRLYHELHRALKRLGKWGRPESMQTLALVVLDASCALRSVW
jgi:hypothetical protein